MNELDKTSPSEEKVNPAASSSVEEKEANVAIEKEETVTITPDTVCDAVSQDECAETVSPAIAIAEAADRASDGELPADGCESEVCSPNASCAETESPAMAIAQAADEAETTEQEKEKFRAFHSMTKQELVDTLAQILEQNQLTRHKDVAAIRRAYSEVNERKAEEELAAFIDAGNAPEEFSSTPDELDDEFQKLVSEFRGRRTEYVAAEEARRAENLAKKRELVAKLSEIADDIDNINLRFNEFKQLQSDFKAIKEIPQSDENDVWKGFQSATELFYDRLKMNKELRDLDFKKNLEQKRQLIDEVKLLEAMDDVVEALRKLQLLREQWREIGPVAKELRDEIWKEFNDSASVVYRRHQDFFEKRKAEEQVAEEAKTKLCVEVEAICSRELKRGSDWEAAAKEIKEIQEKWRTIGFASRKVNNALYARFRKACDDFFAARGEHYKTQRESYDAAIKGKETLISKVEALAAEEDTSKAIAEALKLQEEWKHVGMVPHKLKDQLWQRFRAACDVIFERRKQETSVQRAEQNANLAAKREIIAKLKEIPLDLDRREGIDKIRELQQQWNAIGFVPFRNKNAIQTEYREVVDKLYDNFKMKENRARMNNFRSQIDSMSGDESKLGRERERLLRDLDRKRQELATYRNNLGFFNVKSAAGNSMLKEMERRTRQIEEDIEMLRKKIEMVDGKGEKPAKVQPENAKTDGAQSEAKSEQAE